MGLVFRFPDFFIGGLDMGRSISIRGFLPVLHFTTELLGPNREKTPEGFLLCRNVPIARTGMQLYGSGETPVEDDESGQGVRIHRRPEDVFRPETMNSFNGKPVVIDHPEDDVTPDNWKDLAVGVTLDTRQGVGAENDLLMADLLITDKDAIRAILEEGLDQVSCGYEAEYEEEKPGVGYQVEILGNHVALVEAARCGPRCSIRDEETDMKIPASLKNRIRLAFKAKDNAALESLLEAEGEVAEIEGQGVTLPNGETHIHIHTNEPEAAAAAVEEAEDGDDPAARRSAVSTETTEVPTADDRMAAIDRTLQSINKRLDSLESGRTSDEDEDEGEETDDSDEEKEKTDDEDEEETEEEKEKRKKREAEESKDKAKDSKMKAAKQKARDAAILKELVNEVPDSVKSEEPLALLDSRYMEEPIQQTMMVAEILSPGISFPAFDRKDKPTKTLDSLHKLRQKALVVATSTAHGATIVAELRGGRPLTHDSLEKMSIAQTRDLFFAAGSGMKHHNRTTTTADKTTQAVVLEMQPGRKPTLEEMNELNRKYWEKRA